jgi:phage shock protein PspC (stress-responsive transcriptional regulator)
VVAGVAAGLGDYFGIDPVFFRIAFVVLTFTGGVGIVAYGLLWWLVPPSAEVSNPAEDTVRRLKDAPLWVAVILLVIGGALLVDQAGWWRPDLVWGIALIGLGVLLFYEARGRQQQTTTAGPAQAAVVAPEASPGPVPAPPGATSGLEPTSAWDSDRGVPPPWMYSSREHPPVVVKRRERSGLGLAVMGIALLATGVAAILDNGGLIHLSLAQHLALPLAIIGLGLVVGAWVGRARWLAILAVPILAVMLLGTLVTVPLEGGFGERLYQPATIASAERPFHLIAGRVVLDLTAVPLRRSSNLHATVAAGTIEVMVPRHARVDVAANVGAGEIALFDRYTDGLKVSSRRQVGPPGGPRLHLHLAASFGRIVVFWR